MNQGPQRVMVKIGTRLLDKYYEDRDTQEQKGDQPADV
jgi:hypothetical protein